MLLGPCMLKITTMYRSITLSSYIVAIWCKIYVPMGCRVRLDKETRVHASILACAVGAWVRLSCAWIKLWHATHELRARQVHALATLLVSSTVSVWPWCHRDYWPFCCESHISQARVRSMLGGGLRCLVMILKVVHRPVPLTQPCWWYVFNNRHRCNGVKCWFHLMSGWC